jgi:DHA1 family inner membrane transport protein
LSKTKDVEPDTPNNLLISSLIISSIATYPVYNATSLLLKDISESLGVNIGELGLIQTAASIVSLAFALILSALTIRVKARSLLLAGLTALVVSCLGCGLSQSTLMMSAFYALTGVGSAMISPMGLTLISQHTTEERRSRVIGWFLAGFTFSGIIGLPIVGLIAEKLGWRMAYLGYALPLAALGLLLSFIGVPTSHSKEQKMDAETRVLDSYRAILKNGSARSCLMASILVMMAWQAADLYSAAYYRDRFTLTLATTSILLTVTSLFFTVSSTFSGRLIERFGRKPLAAYSIFLASLMVAMFTSAPDVYTSMIFRILASVFVALFYTAGTNVTLAQIPNLSGMMMSLNQAAIGLGAAIGAALGGFVYVTYEIWAFGPVQGLILVFAAIIFNFLVIDKR